MNGYRSREVLNLIQIWTVGGSRREHSFIQLFLLVCVFDDEQFSGEIFGFGIIFDDSFRLWRKLGKVDVGSLKMFRRCRLLPLLKLYIFFMLADVYDIP